MALVQIVPNSEEWDVAFFQSIQAKVMMRLDEIEPGYVTQIYEELGENDVIMLFEKTANECGFEISKDENGEYWLIKTPQASIASNSIYALIEQYAKSKGLTEDELYKNHSGTGKSHFNIIASNHLRSSNGRLMKSDFNEDSFWQFQDKNLEYLCKS